MKIAAYHVLREQSTTALPATSQFAICVSKFEGNEETSYRQAGKRVVVRKPADQNDRIYYILVMACLRSTTVELK